MSSEKEVKTKGKTQLTTKANLSFNVNKFRNQIYQIYESTEKIKPKCSKAHVYLACVNEVLCCKLIENAQKHIGKDKDGLYTISRQALKYSIELNPNMNKCFHQYLLMYDETLGYENKYPISKKNVITFIESKFGKELHITKQGYDFLTYILIKLTNNIILSSIILLEYSLKKSINYKTINCAIKLELLNSEALCEVFLRQLESTESLIASIKGEGDNEEGEDEDTNVNNNDGDDESDDSDDSDDDDDNDKVKVTEVDECSKAISTKKPIEQKDIINSTDACNTNTNTNIEVKNKNKNKNKKDEQKDAQKDAQKVTPKSKKKNN